MTNKRIDSLISPEIRKEILENRQGGVCGFCGIPVDFEQSEAHHCIPVGQGGHKDDVNNVLVLHGEPCHSIVDDLTDREFYVTGQLGLFDVMTGKKRPEELLEHIQLGVELDEQSGLAPDELKKIQARSNDRLKNPQQVANIMFMSMKRHGDALFQLGVEYGKKLAADALKKDAIDVDSL